MALLALTYTFGGFSSRKKTITVNLSPTPTATISPNQGDTRFPSCRRRNRWTAEYAMTPVVYNPNSFYAPDAGRNIFAFYEPPPPTPYSPTPVADTDTVYSEPTPVPTPPPPQNDRNHFAAKRLCRFEKFSTGSQRRWIYARNAHYIQRKRDADDLCQSAKADDKYSVEFYSGRGHDIYYDAHA